nr:hypothetical protein [Nocardia brasiliensis]
MPGRQARSTVGGGEQPDAVDGAYGGGVHAGEGAGVADGVARRDLGRVPGAGVEQFDAVFAGRHGVEKVAHQAGFEIDTHPGEHGRYLGGRRRGRAGELWNNPGLFGFRQTDPQAQPERFGDFGGEEVAHVLSADPPHQFAGQETPGDGVVVERGSRLPQRRHRFERGHAPRPIREVRCADTGFGFEAAQPGPVGEQVGDRHIRFAVGGELRPVLPDRRIEVELSTFDEQVHAGCRDPFRGRHQHHQRLCVPSFSGDRIVPGPQVDDDPAVTMDTQLRGTRVFLVRLPERDPNVLVPTLDEPLDQHHHSSSRSGGTA